MILSALMAACGAPEPVVPPDPVTVGFCDAWNTTVLDPGQLAEADATVAAAAALGIPIVRPHRPRGHVFSMNLVWRGDAPARWDLPDAVVVSAGRLGVSLLATLYPEADPMSGTGTMPIVVPDDRIAWSAFVTATVERYDGDGIDDMPGLVMPVRSWEIANEPDCTADDVGCITGFTELVSLTTDGVRAADPGAFVIAGASQPLILDDGSRNDGAEAVVRSLRDSGALDGTDALNVHLATGRVAVGVGEILDEWLEIVGKRPIWITEIGTRSIRDEAIVADEEAAEAAWLLDAFDQAAARDSTHVFWCITGGGIDRFPAVTGAIQAYIAGEP